MKKLIALVLAMVCVLSLVSCNNADGNEVMEDFIGIVTNINDDTGYLVEVTDSGSSSLKVGDRVIVLIGEGNSVEYSVNDYIKVEFNGVVEDVVAVSIANKRITRVFDIEKVDGRD